MCNWIDINCPLLSIYVCQTPWMLGNPKTHGVDVNVNWHLASIYRASTKHQHRKLGLILIDFKRDILQSRLRVLYKIAHSIRCQSLNFVNKFYVKSPPLMNFIWIVSLYIVFNYFKKFCICIKKGLNIHSVSILKSCYVS